MNRLRNRIILYVVLGVLAWLALAKLSAPPVDDVIHQRQVEAMLKQGREHREQRKRDSVEIARLRVQAANHRRRADSVRTVRDTMYLPQIVPVACMPWGNALSKCEQETQELRSAIDGVTVALDTATKRMQVEAERADSFETLFRNAPKPCRRVLGVCAKVGLVATVWPKQTVGVGVMIPLF